MLGQRRSRWPSINPTLGEYFVFAGIFHSAALKLAGPDGSFNHVVVPQNSEVPGSNPDRIFVIEDVHI